MVNFFFYHKSIAGRAPNKLNAIMRSLTLMCDLKESNGTIKEEFYIMIPFKISKG